MIYDHVRNNMVCIEMLKWKVMVYLGRWLIEAVT